MKGMAAVLAAFLMLAAFAQAETERAFEPGGCDPFTYERCAVMDMAAHDVIPQRTLAAPEKEALDDVKAHLIGRWLFFSGGELLGMAVEFRDDGTLIRFGYGNGEPSDPVPYAVYAAPAGRYAEEVPYELVLTYADGTVARYGLELFEDEQYGGEAIGLRRGEAGGGYYREGQTLPPRSDGDWG